MATIIVLVGASYGPVAGPNITSQKEKGFAYYDAHNDITTVSYSLNSGFNGNIILQSSLVENPTESDWSDVTESRYDCRSAPSPGENRLMNFKGNFVWMRAVISDYSLGSINSVTMSY